MPDQSELLTVLRQWVIDAENDLIAASAVLRLGRRCPVEEVCFHAQQCVEKYLKSILVSQGISHPKMHDVRLLIAIMPVKGRPSLSVEVQRQLTRYAVVARYPGDYPPPRLSEAREAVKVARRVRSWCRN